MIDCFTNLLTVFLFSAVFLFLFSTVRSGEGHSSKADNNLIFSFPSSSSSIFFSLSIPFFKIQRLFLFFYFFCLPFLRFLHFSIPLFILLFYPLSLSFPSLRLISIPSIIIFFIFIIFLQLPKTHNKPSLLIEWQKYEPYGVR